MITVHGAGRKLIGVNDMKDDEKVYIVASPETAEEMIKMGLNDILITCTFLKSDMAIAIKADDFEKIIDEGVWFKQVEKKNES